MRSLYWIAVILLTLGICSAQNNNNNNNQETCVDDMDLGDWLLQVFVYRMVCGILFELIFGYGIITFAFWLVVAFDFCVLCVAVISACVVLCVPLAIVIIGCFFLISAAVIACIGVCGLAIPFIPIFIMPIFDCFITPAAINSFTDDSTKRIYLTVWGCYRYSRKLVAPEL